MKIWIGVLFAMACLLARPSAGLASESSAADADLRKQVEEVVARIREGGLGEGAALRLMGRQAIPLLIEYANDDNRDVRDIVTLAIGESGDERAIPTLVERLMQDDNPNVWRRAINGLRRHPTQTLERYSPDTLLHALAVHLGRWTGTSPDAALLIGDLGDISQISTLRKILRQAGDTAGQMDAYARAHLVSRMRDACLKALFKLGDKTTTEKVRISFTRSDVPSIVFAVEAVAYAEKSEYLKDLIPLLDDSRDAVRPSPGWPSYLRIKDIAINAIVQVSGIKPSFPLRNLTRYTDDEVTEVKRLTRDTKTD